MIKKGKKNARGIDRCHPLFVLRRLFPKKEDYLKTNQLNRI